MPSNHNRLSQIAQLTTKHFNLAEFKDLCLRLGVDYEHLAGDTLPGRIQELVLLMERQGRTDDLLFYCTALRPNAPWPAAIVPASLPNPLLAPIERNPRLIFLSHASQDASFAQQLAADLRTRGWEVWIAPDSIRHGEQWVEAINRGLAESSVFLLVLSPHAVASKWVNRETNGAIGLENQGALRLIPLDVRPLTHTPPLWLTYQWVSFRDSYPAGLQRLWQALEPDQAKPVNPPPADSFIKQLLARLRPISPRTLGAVGLLLVFLLLWQAVGSFGGGSVTITPTSQATAVTQVALITPNTPTPKPPTSTPTATQTTTPTITPIPSPALGDRLIRPKDSMEMVFVPAGTFMMGSDPAQDPNAEADEQPQHNVTLSAFWLDRTEVTNALYTQCVNAGQCTASEYANDANFNGANFPVVGLSWNDATDYCTWAGAQLPTEAQWEYAARGTDGRLYPWGNIFDSTLANFCTQNCLNWHDTTGYRVYDGYEFTAPVSSYSPAGDSWVGAADMAGNVWEWVKDWYDEDYYADSLHNNPSGPESGQTKALRGGSWFSDAVYLRSAERGMPGYREGNIGFRCVVPLSP